MEKLPDDFFFPCPEVLASDESAQKQFQVATDPPLHRSCNDFVITIIDLVAPMLDDFSPLTLEGVVNK